VDEAEGQGKNPLPVGGEFTPTTNISFLILITKGLSFFIS